MPEGLEWLKRKGPLLWSTAGGGGVVTKLGAHLMGFTSSPPPERMHVMEKGLGGGGWGALLEAEGSYGASGAVGNPWAGPIPTGWRPSVEGIGPRPPSFIKSPAHSCIVR